MKLISSLVIVSLLITPSLQECSTKTNSVTIFPTTDETLNWNLMDEFFNGAGLTFTLSDTQQKAFKIVDPVENTGGHAVYLQAATKIVSARALTSNKYWVNSFVFLNKGATSINLSVAKGETGQSSLAPDFHTVIKVDDITNGLDCYDLEYVSDDAYLVDCQNTVNKKVQNILYYVTPTQSTQILVEEALVTGHQGHLLGQYTVQGQNKQYTYLVRTTPSYSIDGSLSGDSLIEIYLLNDEGQPTNTGYVLDSVTMSQLLDGKHDFEFNIVDVKVLSNGDIYLLDAQYGIYIVNFIPNGQFKLKKQIETGMGQAYAFDRNIFIRRDGRYSENIAILGYGFIELIVDGQLSGQYLLPAGVKSQYPAYIDLSQEFIVYTTLQNTYLFDIDSTSNQLLQIQSVPETNYVLINPFLPDIIVLTLDSAYRYTLSQGYLQYIGSGDIQEQKTLDVIATSGQSTCKVTVTYQIIASDDKQLYQYTVNPTPFPTSITEDAQPFQLNLLSSGPNEQYEQVKTLNEDDTSVTVSVNSFWNLKFANPLPIGLQFQDVLVGKDSSYFFMAQQDKNGQLTVVKATHSSIYSNVATQEKLFDSVSISTKLTKTTFQMWECECPKFHFAYVNNKNLYYKVFSNNKVVDIATVPFTNDVTILFLENYLYALSNGILQSYSEHGEFVAQVNVDLLKTQGYTGTWNPIKIFGNRKFKENLIFVVHADHITILDFHTQFTFIKQIPITNSEVELAIGSETFFIVDADSIVEYDYDRLNQIFKTKSVQLYHYKLLSPLLGDFCSDTGYLFVASVIKSATNDDKYSILAYTPNALQHDSLFKSIELTEKPILISTQGTSEQMYVYVQTETTSTVYALLTNPTMIIQPTINNPQFATTVNLNLKVFNYNDLPSFNIKQDVNVINTQTKVYVSDKFNNHNSLEIQDTSNITTKSLGNDWYSGQIAEFNIKCTQCGSNKGIEITQLVQPQSKSVFGNNYKIKSYFDNNVLQATNALLQVNDDDTLSDTILEYIFTSDTYQCFQGTSNEQYILSLCYDGAQYTIYAVSKLSITGWSVIGEVFQLGTTIQKIQLLDNDLLVILDDKSLVVSTINMDQDQWELVEEYTLDLTYIQQSFESIESFTPNDFIVSTVNLANNKQYYKIIVTSGEGLFIEDFYYNTNVFQPAQFQHVDLSAELVKVKQYATPTTKYMQIISLADFADNKLNLFIQTSNVVHYGLTVVFQTVQGQDYISYSSITVNFLLNRYGKWKTLNHVAISDDFAAIPYQSDDGKILVGVYPITKEPTKPTTMIGSYTWSNQESVSPFDFGLFFRQKRLYGSSVMGEIFIFNIINEPILTFTNSAANKLVSQNITIEAKNDFSVASPNFTLTVSATPTPPGPPTPDDDDPNGGSNAWWIILVCVGGVLILGGIGYLVYRSRTKKQTSDDDYQAIQN